MDVETGETQTEIAREEVLHLSISMAAFWEGTAVGEALEKNCEKLEEWSEGTIDICIYDGGVMGSDSELIPGVQQGTLSIVNSVSAAQVSVVPEAALLSIPCIFDSYEEYNQLLQGEFFDTLQTYYNKAGLQLLCCFGNEYRDLTTNRPVYDVEDLKGMKIRTLDNPFQIAFWKSFGMEASYYRYNDLYAALQQGMYDAQENAVSAILGGRFYETQKYMIRTQHVVIDNVFIMNKKQYDALSEDHKELLKRFFDAVTEDVLQVTEEKDMIAEKDLTDRYGMEIIEPDQTFIAKLKQGCEPAIALLREHIGSEIVDQFLEALRFFGKTP